MENGQSELSLDEWKAHLEAAKNYPGTNTKYCREHGLVAHQFVYYKGKFAKQRRSQSKFVKVESLKEPKIKFSTLSSLKSGSGTLPDPEWLAKFLQSYAML